MSEVVLQPWSEHALPLLEKLLGDPEMMTHLGGPESKEQILRRHQRYLRLPESGIDHMFIIAWGPNSEAVGNVGYWKKTWREQSIYETGWLVLPTFQGKGIATKYQFIHAFPSVANVPSNAICRKLGYTFVEECQVEYPPGNSLVVNDWRLDLFK